MTTFHDVWLQKLLLKTPQIWGKSLQLTGKETSSPLDLLSFQIWALYVKRYERILPLPLAVMLEILTIFKWACSLSTLIILSKSAHKFHKFLARHQPAARGHSQQFQRLQPPSVDALKYAFFPRTIPVWNALPVELVEAESLEAFKLRLQSLQ